MSSNTSPAGSGSPERAHRPTNARMDKTPHMAPSHHWFNCDDMDDFVAAMHLSIEEGGFIDEP